jgi:hypothetical protein
MPPSIFQQIVLPYLASTPIPARRSFVQFFSSSIPRARAPSNTDPSSSSHGGPTRAWDYVPPITPLPYNTGHDPPPRPPKPLGSGGGEVMAFLKRLEEMKGARHETLLMALEKIASIPEQQELEEKESRREAGVKPASRGKKGRIRTESGMSPTRVSRFVLIMQLPPLGYHLNPPKTPRKPSLRYLYTLHKTPSARNPPSPWRLPNPRQLPRLLTRKITQW